MSKFTWLGALGQLVEHQQTIAGHASNLFLFSAFQILRLFVFLVRSASPFRALNMCGLTLVLNRELGCVLAMGILGGTTPNGFELDPTVFKSYLDPNQMQTSLSHKIHIIRTVNLGKICI